MEKNNKLKMRETDYILHKPLTISDEPNKFVIQKAGNEDFYEINKNKNYKIISRIKDANSEPINGPTNSSYEAYGILGVFSSDSTEYLIVISEAIFVGDILNSKIYQIKNVCTIFIILKFFFYFFNFFDVK
jgi:hypothetical protein